MTYGQGFERNSKFINCRVIEHDLPVNGAHEEISMNFELVQERHFSGQVSMKIIAFAQHRIGLAAAIALFAAMCSNAFAQTYPSKLVTILVGFPAGGPADGTARILSEELAKIWGRRSSSITGRVPTGRSPLACWPRRRRTVIPS
jgi:hypothetical protein